MIGGAPAPVPAEPGSTEHASTRTVRPSSGGVRALTDRLGRLAFGGDYNPEQWDEEVWKQDDLLMRRARVNLATVGVFSWAMLEPDEGRYEFSWLDAHLDRLHANGVAVDLATPTASPPPWFTLAHPEAMPVTAEGVRLSHGSRDTYCLAAPAYRRASERIAAALAERYGDHPAVAMWHVHNEYATICWCDQAAAEFRVWLRRRYGDLDELNRRWGTAFWSQLYGSWEQVQPPRVTQWHRNPAHGLDYRRFWSDLALAAFREQRDTIRAHSNRPVTTNLMVPGYQTLDLWAFGREVDFVGIDHYPDVPGVEAAADIAFGGDRARSFGAGRPWLLIEQGTSTVYASDRTLPKQPGDLLRHTLGHIARGSDGALFFQWRQSAAGAEQWHSAMVPHAGPDSRIFREVSGAGAAVARLAELAGSTVTAQVAVLHDSDCWWALDAQGLPSSDLDYHAALRRAHRTLWGLGVTADFAHPVQDLSPYRMVVAPALFMLSDAAAESLRDYVAGGGTLLVQHFAGAVDEHHRARLGGYPAEPLREALGIRVEEYRPIDAGETIGLSDGTCGSSWTEVVRVEPARGGGPGAETVAAYLTGALEGLPALTRNPCGDGTGWYLSTRLDDRGYTALLERLLDGSGVAPVLRGHRPAGHGADGVEAVRRTAADRSWLFLLNHGAAPVRLDVSGEDVLTGRRFSGEEGLLLAVGDAVVLRQQVGNS